MLKSKFLNIVRTFSPAEMKDFRNFVRSPFHNTNKKVIAVTEIVAGNFNNLDNNMSLSKEKIFTKIYPGKKYNDTVMRILLSDLLKLAEEYLAYLNFKSSSSSEKKHLLRELSDRKLNRLYHHQEKIALDNVKDTKVNVYYYYDLFELMSIRIEQMISEGRQPDTAPDVMKQGEYLIYFFFISILNIAHELSIQKDIMNINPEYDPIENFFSCFDLNKFLKYENDRNPVSQPVLQIYYCMYLSVLQPDNTDHADKLKDLVFEHMDRFSREEVFNLFIILESLGTSATVSGHKKYFEYLMEIYRHMLNKDIYKFKDDDYLQINLFRNMYYTALALKERQWAKDFIDKHHAELNPDYRDDATHLAYAYYYYDAKEYSRALEEASQVKLRNFVFKLDVRLLTFKIYYDMKADEEALSLTDSFTHFLNSNKSFEYYREGFINFLKAARQLLRIRSGDSSADPGLILKEIKKIKKISNRSWLIEKASELER